ncbi:MAG: S9 family peptidase [Ignavibacteriae bacterium]|nr:S9 family peptidase [Ignavibacteriota bacterium]
MKQIIASAIVALSTTINLFAQQKEWTIDDIFASQKFAFKSLPVVQWYDGGKKFSYLETDQATKQRNLHSYDVATGKRETVVDASLLVMKAGEKSMRIGSYEWSRDGKFILVTGTLPARRTKSGGAFGVFDVAKKTFRVLSDTSLEQAIIHFSPDAKKVGFVRSNNLFVIDIATGKETQLTFDGSENVLNGKFDWVYEEEFSIIDGWQWSPDSKRIAFWRLDQSNVPTFPLVNYSSDDAHAEVETMRYPKPGDPNSLVRVGIAEIASGRIAWVDLGAAPDIYVTRINWTRNAELLAVQRMNRAQDTLQLLLADAKTGNTRSILTEVDTAWVESESDDLTFLEDGKHFLWTSYRDGYTHIYLYRLDGTLVRQVTQGNWNAVKIEAVDEKRQLIYYTGTEATPLERHLYRIGFDGTGKKQLTESGSWHSINMSPDHATFIDSYSSFAKPASVVLRRADGTEKDKLVINTTDVFESLPLAKHEFFTMKTSDEVPLNGWMIKPADFDPNKKYPVLMHVYGVGGQTVVNRWGGHSYLWYQMLAQKGYIIVSVDGRGTGGYDKAFIQVVHRRLGMQSTLDQIEAAKYLGSLPFVDAKRIGIWGWSGGGYSTCMAMMLGAEVFKTGIAVAAVTDFKFYDSIWSERFMDTPEENPEGYKETSVMTHAAKLKGNLLIVHGTTDDNVHWQNAIVLINELIRQNKQVETMFYPGRRHGISGDNATRHLYTLMTRYIFENL